MNQINPGPLHTTFIGLLSTLSRAFIEISFYLLKTLSHRAIEHHTKNTKIKHLNVIPGASHNSFFLYVLQLHSAVPLVVVAVLVAVAWWLYALLMCVVQLE